MTPVVAKNETYKFTLKVPSNVKNSPTNPLVPGRPIFAIVNTRKKAA